MNAVFAFVEVLYITTVGVKCWQPCLGHEVLSYCLLAVESIHVHPGSEQNSHHAHQSIMCLQLGNFDTCSSEYFFTKTEILWTKHVSNFCQILHTFTNNIYRNNLII